MKEIEGNLENPCYYAIIPANVRYDKELTDKAKLLYGEITSLTNKSGVCWASNKYFSKLYNCDEKTITRNINLLCEKGYLKTEYEAETGALKKRYITVNINVISDLSQLESATDKNVCREGQKCPSTGDKNVRYNNTSINKRNNITKVILQRKEIFKAIISHLNEVTGSKYRANTQMTQTKINARLNEGYNLDDFIAVIDKKSEEWLGTDMERFLRPETLFGTKFEGYLNQKQSKKHNKKDIEAPVPDWLNKEISKGEASPEEIAEMEALLQEFRE